MPLLMSAPAHLQHDRSSAPLQSSTCSVEAAAFHPMNECMPHPMPMRSCRLIRRANRGPSSTSAPAGAVRLPALAPGCARRGQSSRDEQCRVFSQTAAALLSLKLDNAGRTVGRGRSERASGERGLIHLATVLRASRRPSFLPSASAPPDETIIHFRVEQSDRATLASAHLPSLRERRLGRSIPILKAPSGSSLRLGSGYNFAHGSRVAMRRLE